jgi:lipoprotein-releasing system ATP-binding protein
MTELESPASGVPIELSAPSQSKVEIDLVVSDLRKAFQSPSGDRIEVLKGTSFTASGGQMIAITGASGAGKSTLLHVVGGLESADHGKMTLAGISIERAGARELALVRNRRIGFIFQFHHLLSDLTAVENVALPLWIGRVSRSQATVRAAKLLQELGLSDRADHPIGHLSGGEQQRVAVARALINEPLLLLADEPTGNLDADTGDEIGEILLSYSRRRVAITIVVTHNKRLAQACDRTMVLHDGRLHHS